MASITDCVVEGLKYPFNDLKKLVGFGVLFALLSAVSVFISAKSFDVFRLSVHTAQAANTTLSHIQASQLPAGDIYLTVALMIASFIISLFIFGYQYDIVKFSIEKRPDLPGFDNILGMLINGIKYFIVILAYNIIPVIVALSGFMFYNNLPVMVAIFVISMILFIIAGLLMIMALNNMVAHDDFKKAFDFRQITGNISNLGWGKYVGIIIFTIIVYMIIMVAVNFILGLLTGIFTAVVSNQVMAVSVFIAVIEGLLIDSYGALFFNRVCGSIYRESIK